MDDPTIKVCFAKAIWNKDDEGFISHELAKQICANRYDNEVKIYQSCQSCLKCENVIFDIP